MEKHYYGPGILERSLEVYEGRFGLPTTEFLAAYEGADATPISHVPGFHRALWSSLERELRELRDGDLASRVERELELA